MMIENDILRFLCSRHAKEMKLGLEHIQNLLDRLTNPQHRFKSIHIAGTNGKGSTAAILESIFMQAGYKTGLFTSPHLIVLEERIRINRENIPHTVLLDYVQRMKQDILDTETSFFEIMTAVGFQYFADQQVDIAIIETGLGGRLDATNTLTPELAIITEIGLDHTRILGDTLQMIAMEKAGIIKAGAPAVIGSKHETVQQFYRQVADERGIRLHIASQCCLMQDIRLTEFGTDMKVTLGDNLPQELHLNLPGEHQLENLATALTACHVMRGLGWPLSDEAIASGVSQVHWRARLDLLQTRPKILLDSAHNPLGMKRLAHALQTLFTYNRLILLFGVLADKDYMEMLALILPLTDTIILTQPLSDRALNPRELEHLAVNASKKTIVEPVIGKAWRIAADNAGEEDLICAAGSIYFVGECLKIWDASQK